MGNFPADNRLITPTYRINLEKSGPRREPFTCVTLGSKSGKSGGLRQRDCSSCRGSFPTRYLEGGLLPQGPGRVELKGRVGFGKRGIFRLANLNAPAPTQNRLGRKVHGRGIQEHDALSPCVARRHQADPIGQRLSRIIAPSTWLEDQERK
jgi:hypothetical protein